MSINLVPNWAVQQYSTNLELEIQQVDSRLGAFASHGSYQGKQASPVDYLGPIEMREVTGRFEPIGRVDATTDRRWIYPKDFDVVQLIDSFDILRILQDPKSAYIRESVAAANRKSDALINAAFFGVAKTGEQGGTEKAFGTDLTSAGGNNVAVAEGAGAATGLNVKKLREAMKRLIQIYKGELPEVPKIAINAIQHDNLLGQFETTNKDFTDRPVLTEGRIRHFMGFDFVLYEGLTTGTDDASGTSRQVPVWMPSGMHLGTWRDKIVDVDRIKTIKGHPWQIYLYMTINATRLSEDKVLRIWCRE